MRSRPFAGILAALLALSAVSAAPSFSFGSSLQNISQVLYTQLSNEYVVWATTMVLFFVLLYSIFSASLRKVKVFSAGDKISREGKMVAVTLGLIGDIGLFYTMGSTSVSIERIAGTMGWFGGIAFAGMIYAITYYNMKTNEEGKMAGGAAWAAAGLALLVYGQFANNPSATELGSTILVIAAIVAGIFGLRGLGGRGAGAGGAGAGGDGAGGGGAGGAGAGGGGAGAGGGQGGGAGGRGGPMPQQVQGFQGRMNP